MDIRRIGRPPTPAEQGLRDALEDPDLLRTLADGLYEIECCKPYRRRDMSMPGMRRGECAAPRDLTEAEWQVWEARVVDELRKLADTRAGPGSGPPEPDGGIPLPEIRAA